MRYTIPAVVMGLSPAGLYLVRELAAAGVTVIGMSEQNESGACSRYLRRSGGFYREPDSWALLARVLEIGSAVGNRPLLLPSSDRYIEWISNHYSVLSESAYFSASYHPDRVGQFIDKSLFYDVCEAHGVPYPRQIALAQYRDYGGIELPPFPVLIKPGRLHEVTDIMAGRKVFVCRNEEELQQRAIQLPAGRGGWMIQEIVEGGATSIFCMGGVRDRSGNIQAAVSGRKLRQFPPGYGTASALLTEEAPDLLWNYTRRLLDAVDLDGFFEIEFKQDSKDGLWKVFEINARTALWFQAAHVAGIPLALTGYLHHTGLRAPEPQYQIVETEIPLRSVPEANVQMEGVMWRSGLKDLIGRFSAQGTRRNEAEADTLPVKRVSAWAVWDRQDPLPACAELIGYAKKFLGRLLRR